MSLFRFTEDREKREISCQIYPGAASEISAFKLREAWRAAEFNTCFLFDQRIDAAVVEAMTKLAQRARTDTSATALPAPIDEAADGAGTTDPLAGVIPLVSVVLAERRDASCTLAVSDDHMNVDATVLSPHGGAPVSEAMIQQALTAAKVSFGINDTAISSLVVDASAAAPGTQMRRRIAEGRMPGAGTPSRFENLVVPFQDRVLTPKQRADGSIDHHDLGEIATVQAGAQLLRRWPAQPGPDGSDVYGEVMPGYLPDETQIAVGEGTQIAGDDPNLLIAARTGVPHKITGGMSVNDVLQLADVDLHVGNVEFDGSLVVKGDIRPDMKVRISKDLIVAGFIESADVEAGGDISAKQGIMGPAAFGSGRACRVKGRSITAHYAQNAELEAVEDITLTTHATHCVVHGCRALRVGGERQKNARLIGGVINAADLVMSGIIGADAGTPTRIAMDFTIHALREQVAVLRSRMTKLLETIAGLERPLKELSNLPRNPQLDDKLKRIANTMQQYRSQIEGLETEESRTKQLIESKIQNCRVVVVAKVYPGVELRCLETHHRFGNERGAATFAVRDGNWVAIEG